MAITQPVPNYALPFIGNEEAIREMNLKFNPIWLKWFLDLVNQVAGAGTVSGVGLSAPTEFTVSGSPVTTTGVLTFSKVNQSANTVWAGPNTGAPAQPAFRALVAADLPAGTGSVTSVGLAAPTEFTVSGSPVTGSGTLTFSKANQSANIIYAGPNTGIAAAPTFRALVTADISAQMITYAKIQNVTDARLLGRSSGSAGAPMEITVGSGLSLSAGALTVTGGGDVVGPASATDNAIARFDLTTGKLIQNSAIIVDDSGRLLTGNTTALTNDGSTPTIQVMGTTTDTSSASIGRWSADALAPTLFFTKARGAAVNTNTIVQNGDTLGAISFLGSNGTNFNHAAQILGTVDGAPGASLDMPGLLDFRTSSDATASVTSRMQIRASGHVLVNTTTDTASLGNIQIGTTSDTTTAAGVLFGTDTQLFRGAANTLVCPDMFSARLSAGTPYTSVVSASSLLAIGSNYALTLCDGDRAANDRKAELAWGAGNLDLRFIRDDYGAVVNIMRVTGGFSTGATLLSIPTPTNNVIGHTASVTVGNAGKLQVMGSTAAASQSQVSGFANDATTAGSIALSKSRSGTVGTNTIVTSGDVLGKLIGYGANGSTYTAAGQISFESDGTPGASDMPGRIVISTTPDGSTTLTEALRVDNAQKTIFQVDRSLRFNNQTSSAGAAAGTLLNAPTVGDPGYWLKINIAGTNYAIPCWAG